MGVVAVLAHTAIERGTWHRGRLIMPEFHSPAKSESVPSCVGCFTQAAGNVPVKVGDHAQPTVGSGSPLRSKRPQTTVGAYLRQYTDECTPSWIAARGPPHTVWDRLPSPAPWTRRRMPGGVSVRLRWTLRWDCARLPDAL